MNSRRESGISYTSEARGLTKNPSRNPSRSPFDDKKRRYRKKQKKLTQEQIEVFRQAFEIFDSNKSGVK